MRLETAWSLLANAPLFHDVPAAELAALKSSAHCRTLTAHKDMLVEGKRSDLVYMIAMGSAKVTQWTKKRDIILCFAGQGDVLGDISALNRCPHTATVTTLERSAGVYWLAEEFYRCLTSAPMLSINIARINQSRLRRRGGQVASMAVLTVPGQLAQRLLFMAEDRGRKSRNGHIEVPFRLTQETLADLIGVSRKTIGWALADFQEQKILTARRAKYIVIHDLAALKAQCCL